MKTHDWEPTDNQGYTMECTTCGKSISFENNDEWNNSINEECPPAN